jgi:putative ABC transport system permease protein
MLISGWAGLRLGWSPVVALARAGLQLGVVALLLRGILAVPWTVLGFLVLMLSTASWTSAGRLSQLRHGRLIATVAVVAGAGVSLAAVFAVQLVALDARQVVAVAGIVIGNAMTAATLAGRTFSRQVLARRDEVEAWLALGATPRVAHADVARESARESLLPTLDQTRATGLVTLPGAFVGALFGGASPAVAAQFQLVVLAAIMLAMTVTSLVVTRLAATEPTVPLPSRT